MIKESSLGRRILNILHPDPKAKAEELKRMRQSSKDIYGNMIDKMYTDSQRSQRSLDNFAYFKQPLNQHRFGSSGSPVQPVPRSKQLPVKPLTQPLKQKMG